MPFSVPPGTHLYNALSKASPGFRDTLRINCTALNDEPYKVAGA